MWTVPMRYVPLLKGPFNSGKASLVNVIMDPGAGRRQQEFGWLSRTGQMRY